MRIAQVMAGGAEGADLFFERMTLALAEAGETVLPVVREDDGRGGRLINAGMRPVQLRFGGALDLVTQPKMAGILRRFKAELAVAWTSRAAVKLPRGDWVNVGRVGLHDDLTHFSTCDFLVGQSPGLVERTKWPAARVKYLPRFVDDFVDEEAVPRASIGVPEDANVMVGVGRLEAGNGFDIVIRAAALLPEVHCVIAGEGPERARLEALIAELKVGGRVKLLGWRSDMGALLKCGDIFVSAARRELAGEQVLAAFGAQIPVLATKALGADEVIRDGVDGVLVPVDDVAAVAVAARAMVGDVRLRVRLALAARQRFAAEFSKEVALAQWLDFFRAVRG